MEKLFSCIPVRKKNLLNNDGEEWSIAEDAQIFYDRFYKNAC
jgi:hypothetical protein